MHFFRMAQPSQHVIPGDSAQQRRWVDTTRTREAPSTSGASRGPTRSLRSALEVVYRPSMFDGRRLSVEWHPSCRKVYRHSRILIPRFLARAPLGHTLPIHARAVSTQGGAWQPHALPRQSCACQPVVETSRQRSELLFCSSSPLGNPYQVFRLCDTHVVKMKCSRT